MTIMEDANTLYLIYGSYKGGKFKAMDINAGVQVNNLIYATMFYPALIGCIYFIVII